MSAPAPPTSKYLGIYLNDHLGGASTGVELVQRIADQYEGTGLGASAILLARQIEEDRETLLEIMGMFGVTEDRAKAAVGWVGEKLSRLKPDGDLTDRSPLAPVIELEGLSLGIEGKRSLWVALAETEATAARIGGERLQGLIRRAEEQRERVEQHRVEEAREAFTA